MGILHAVMYVHNRYADSSPEFSHSRSYLPIGRALTVNDNYPWLGNGAQQLATENKRLTWCLAQGLETCAIIVYDFDWPKIARAPLGFSRRTTKHSS